jgi:SAM-dependent methyltransferase
MKRHEVYKTHRLIVTEAMILGLRFRHVLEVGSGDFSFDYLRKDNVASWIKADFAPPCDVICDVNAQNLRLPFEDRTFDLIICTEVLEHLLWPQQLLRECFRLLSEKGKLILSVPNIVSLSYRIAWIMGRIPSCAASGNLPPELGRTSYLNEDGEFAGGHVVDFSLSRLVALLRLENFAIVKIKGSGIIWHGQILPHWLVPPALSSNIICLAEKR